MRHLFSGFLAVTLLGVATAADAAVTATIVLTELRVAGDGANNTITLRLAAGNPAQLQVLSGATVVGTSPRRRSRRSWSTPAAATTRCW
jgi:hypothetical protein